MLILSLDPSMTCTGYAVLSADGEKIIDAGVITCSGEEPGDRAWSLANDAMDLVDDIEKKHPIRGEGITVCVVEYPFANHRRPSGQVRSVVHLPMYGVAVGAIDIAMRLHLSEAEHLRPAADEWSRGYPAAGGDRDKARRVALVKSMYPGIDLGPKSKAGNVADAILMGRWAAARIGAKGAQET